MSRVNVPAALLLSLTCAPALAQQAAPDVWRMHTEHLAADRAAIRACLAAHEDQCEQLIQKECRAAYSEDAQIPALFRQCDWRAIAAWEDEMNDTLARLRRHLGDRNLANLEASQVAWNTSMLADVGLGMDAFEGGSLAGPLGAHIRARATVQRALYLRDMAQTLLDDLEQ